MILICPICATRYQIDDPEVSDGCAVQCAACGHGWKVLAQPSQEVQVHSAVPETGSDACGKTGLGRADVESMRREAEDALMRASPQYSYRRRQKTRHHARVVLAAAVPWIFVAVVVVVGAVVALVWRSDIVRMWPQAQRAYALVGLDVAYNRFVLRDLQVAHDSDAGKMAMVVRGRAVNETGFAHSPPVVDITLIDQEGQRLQTYRTHIARDVIAPGASGEFSLRIPDVPAAAHSVDVYFSVADSGQESVADDGSADRDDH